jgi:dTDP-4-dehydrorhamnose reductase
VWLLVGGDSEVGAATRKWLQEAGREVAATTRRPERASAETPFLDLAVPLDRWQPPAGTRAVCIFAAVARLAACESDPAGSAHINVAQTLTLVERLVAAGIYVLHLSTNQVFDGTRPRMLPDAPTCPVSEYGRQKARAEAGILERMRRGAPVAILRLAKVLSPDTPLLRDWVAALATGAPIRPFHDMTMAPTPIEIVARAVAALMDERAPGIFQLTGPRDVSYAEVGYHLAERLRADPQLVTPVSAATMALAFGAAPPHTTLDSTHLAERYGLVAPDPFAAVEISLAMIRGAGRG